MKKKPSNWFTGGGSDKMFAKEEKKADRLGDWFGTEQKAFERVEQTIREKKADKLGDWLEEFGKGEGLVDFAKEFQEKSGKDDYL